MLNEQLKKNAQVFWQRGVFLFALLIIVDQVAKLLARQVFKNSAFAFSLPVPVRLIFFIYAVVIAGMIYYVRKNYQYFSFYGKIAWVLIFAGAASNILERIFLGCVRDFIYITFYSFTGVYNLADGYIIVGIIILLLSAKKNYSN